jgi:hypothetical protein
VIGGLRQAEILSEKHWTIVYLLQNPNWRGEGIVVEKRGGSGVVLIPALMGVMFYRTRIQCGTLVADRWSTLHMGTMATLALTGLLLAIGSWRLSEPRAASIGPGLLTTGISLGVTFLLLDIALRLTMSEPDQSLISDRPWPIRRTVKPLLEDSSSSRREFVQASSGILLIVRSVDRTDQTRAFERPQSLVHLTDVQVPNRTDPLVEPPLEMIPVILLLAQQAEKSVSDHLATPPSTRC